MTDHCDPSQDVAPRTWVAIDVAKDWHTALMELSGGHRRAFRVANRREDIERLIAALRAAPQPVRIAFEPTADYHRPLAYRLVTAGLDVCLVSSIACARYREARFNSWDKNDPKDAAVILDLLKQGLTQRYYDPLVHGTHDLQELSKTYFQVALARTRVQHSLINHYLPLYFPELERYWHTTRTEWIVRFLLAFPVPAAITALDKEAFVEAAWPVVGRKVRKRALLEELYELAACTLGLPVTADSVAVAALRLRLEHFLALTQQRGALERQADALLHTDAAYRQLRTIPGIGPIFALTILAEAGDVTRFTHHRQFLKFCGLDLAKSQSGTMRGPEHVSKRGNARLRCAFWCAGRVAVRMRENSFREKYDRYLRADPASADRKRKALTAVAAKMARVAYAVVKTNRPYRSYFEHALPSGELPSGSTSLNYAVQARAVAAAGAVAATS